MAATGSDQATADLEVVISRLIDGPRELVIEACADVRHLSQWWDPDGFTTTTRSFRVGGVWDFVMHGPDGTDYPNWINWREIVPPVRVTLLHGESEVDRAAFEAILTFETRGERTEIVLRTVFPTMELHDPAVEQYGAIEAGKQTLGNLADYITGMAPRERTI